MAEYIERKAFRKALEIAPDEWVKGRTVEKILDSIPAADVAPVVHGEWKNIVHAVVDTTGDCSRCGKQAIWRTRNKPYVICPNCGAKMDEERKEQNV